MGAVPATAVSAAAGGDAYGSHDQYMHVSDDDASCADGSASLLGGRSGAAPSGSSAGVSLRDTLGSLNCLEGARRKPGLLASARPDASAPLQTCAARSSNVASVLDGSTGGSGADDGGAEWGGVADLDQFFARMYAYYRERGFLCIVLARITHLLSLAFTILFSVFLFLFVDWTRLMQCHSGATCLDLEEYVELEPAERLWRDPLSQSMWEQTVFGYAVTFSLYWVWSLCALFPTVRWAWAMKSFYRLKLGIGTRQLQTMKWAEVTQRLCQLQCNRQYVMQINKQELNAHDVACRIMRRDNYLIALFNRGVLDLSVPVPCLLRCPLEKIMGKLNTSMYLTKHLEWNVKLCILDHIFNDQFAVRQRFIHNVGALKWRFRAMAVANFVLMPFILIFSVVYFFMKHAEEFHARRDYLGPREWSPLARWHFREFNELPHAFERRLRASHFPASKYEKLFPMPAATIVARFLAYVSGAVLGMMLVFTLLDEHVMLQVHLFDRNLLWYIAVLTGIVSALRGFVPAEQPLERVQTTHEVMKELVQHTHYMPSRWRNRDSDYDTRDELLSLYRYKVVLFLMEVSSVVLAPFVLWFSLPSCAEDVCAFVRDFTMNVDGLGHVCGYSLFDFQKYGDARYAGAPADGAESPTLNGRGDGRAARLRMRSRQGKMEKSFLSFMASHPDWTPPEAGGALLQSLSQFRESIVTEEAAAARDASSSFTSGASFSLGGSRSFGQGSMSASASTPGRGAWSRWSALSQSASGAGKGAGMSASATAASAAEASVYTWLDRYYERHAGDGGSPDAERVTSVAVVTRGDAHMMRGRRSYVEMQSRTRSERVV
jgi:autophagy-related protein 9